MMDREKVIKGLKICSDCGFCESIKKFDLRCPYRNNDGKGCDRSRLLMDALALLQEQEAVVRCKDCKWYDEKISICDNCHLPREQTFFCADGVAKDINVHNKEGR